MQFKTKPYQHQLEAFNQLKSLPYAALLADMGTGKSKILIDLMIYNNIDRVLITAPKAVCPQWTNEQFPFHYYYPFDAFNIQAKNTIKYTKALDRFMYSAKRNLNMHVLTINFEGYLKKDTVKLLHEFLKTGKRQALIVDEASRIKTLCKTTKIIHSVSHAFPKAKKYVATGTPAAKGPQGLWSIYHYLKPRYFNCSYTSFVSEYVIQAVRTIKRGDKLQSFTTHIDKRLYDNVYSALVNHGMPFDRVQQMFGVDYWNAQAIINSPEFTIAKNLDKLKELIAPCTYSVKKSECFDLPEKIETTIKLPLNVEQKRLIRDLSNYSLAVYGSRELTLQAKQTLGLRVLQICGGFVSTDEHRIQDQRSYYKPVKIAGKNHKLDFIKNDIPEIGEQQFVIWAVFKPELQMLGEELQEYAVYMPSLRQEVLDDFKKGYIQGLIMHPRVGGFGLNLQNASVQYSYSRDYSTEYFLQAIDRSHRLGIIKSPTYKYLVSDSEFERNVLDILHSGEDVNSELTSMEINGICK